MKKRTHFDSKRQEIMSAAVHLFAVKGIDGTSVKEIGAEAGVTDAAIYKHFATKKELIQFVFSDYYDTCTRIIDHISEEEQSFRVLFQKLIISFLDLFEHDPYGFMLLHQHHEYCTELEKTQRLPVVALADFIQRGVDSGELPNQNAKLTAALLIGTLTNLAIFIETGVLPTSLRELAPDIQQRLRNLVGLM